MSVKEKKRQEKEEPRRRTGRRKERAKQQKRKVIDDTQSKRESDGKETVLKDGMKRRQRSEELYRWTRMETWSSICLPMCSETQMSQSSWVLRRKIGGEFRSDTEL